MNNPKAQSHRDYSCVRRCIQYTVSLLRKETAPPSCLRLRFLASVPSDSIGGGPRCISGQEKRSTVSRKQQSEDGKDHMVPPYCTRPDRSLLLRLNSIGGGACCASDSKKEESFRSYFKSFKEGGFLAEIIKQSAYCETLEPIASIKLLRPQWDHLTS